MSEAGFGANLRRVFSLNTTSDELLHLDFMRFIASAGIVLCHSGEFFVPRADRLASHERLAGLSLFVDVFFIISGFVIAHVYADRMGTWRQFARFMQRRVGRLFPLHLVTLLGVALLFYLIGMLNLPTNSDFRVKPECLILGTVLLHAVIDCGGAAPNFVNWSISAEMVMYALFPLLLVLGRKLGPLRYVLWLILLTLIATNSLGRGIWAENQHFWRALPAFFFGLVVRLDWKLFCLLPMPSFIPITLAASLAAGSLLIWPDWLLLTIAYGVALSAIIADGRCRPSAITRRFAPLGQLTYSIYMLHLIVVLIIPNALGDKLLKLSVVPLSLLTVTSYGILAFASLLSYKLLETPARRYIDGIKLVPPGPSQEANDLV